MLLIKSSACVLIIVKVADSSFASGFRPITLERCYLTLIDNQGPVKTYILMGQERCT